MDQQKLIDEGYRLYLQCKNEEALNKYNEALRFKGKFPKVLYNRGLVYQQLGYDDKAALDFYKALRIYRNLVQQNSLDLDSKNYLGLAYFRLGHFEKAIEIFNEIIRCNKKNWKLFRNRDLVCYSQKEYEKAISDALRNRSLVYYSQKEYEKAIKDLYEAIKLNKRDIETLYNLGLLYYSIKEYQKGHETFQKLLKVNPEYVNAWWKKGIEHYASGIKCSRDWEKEENFVKAMNCFNSAIELNSKYSLAFNSLGRLYLTRKNYDKAAEEFNKAINIDDKEKMNSYTNLGLLYFKQKRYDDALIEFEEAKKISPSSNLPRFFILYIYKNKKKGQEDKSSLVKGEILFNNKEYDKAIEAFNNVKEGSIEYPNALKWMGDCHYFREKEGDFKEAIDKYRKSLESLGKISLEKNRDKADLIKKIGNCYFRLKDSNKALFCYDEACKIDPNFAVIYYNSGVVHYLSGNYIESERKYTKAIELDSKYCFAYNNMSYMLYKMERYKESLQACNQCLECKVNYDNALIIKGLIHLRLGQYTKALKAAEKAVDLFPSNDEAWYNKGSIHYFLEQFDEAHKAFDKAIKLNKIYAVSSWQYKGITYAKCGNYEKAVESFSKAKEIINEKTNTERKTEKYLVPLLLRESFVFYLFGKYQDALDNLNLIGLTSDINAKHIIVLSKLKVAIYEKLGNHDEIEKSFKEAFSNLKILCGRLDRSGRYSANVYCEKGIILRRRGNYKDSIEVFEAFDETLKKNPSDFNLMNEIGIAFRKFGETCKALESFENALQINQNNSEAWINKALVLRGLLKYDKSEYSFKRAISTLETAIKLNNNYSFAHYLIGLIYYDCHDYEKALSCFERASKSKEYHEDAEINKGLALFYLERYDEAICVFDSLINKSNSIQTKVDSLNNKGIVLLTQKEEELAYSQFKEAAELDPYNAESKNNMGIVRYSQKKYKHALKLFDESISIEETYNNRFNSQALANAWNNKGILLFKMEKFEEAKKLFDKSIKVNPEYSYARKNKGVILCKLGEHEEALSNFNKASLIRSKEGKINLLLASSLLKLGDIQKADEEIKKTFKDSSMSSDEKSNAYNIKGQINIEKLDYDGAISSFEKAIDLNPSNLSLLVWNTYAKYLKAEFLINQDEQEQSQSQNRNQSKEQISERINPINKKYQEYIVSIIRDLEKVSIEFSKKQNSTNLHLLFWLRLKIMVNKFEKLVLFFYGIYEVNESENELENESLNKSKGQKKIYRFLNVFSDLKGDINLSIMEHDYEKMNEERIIDAYILYFTGYLYYKINDFHSALYKLKKCVEMKGGENISNPAKSLIQTIWDYHIRPPFWRWWLYYPVNKWRKRTMFGIILVSICAVLFPSFNNSLNFINNTNQYLILAILLLMLLFPSIEHIKGKDLEIKLKESPAPFVDFCPLTPDFTPEKSTTLIHIKKRPRPLEIHEIGADRPNI